MKKIVLMFIAVVLTGIVIISIPARSQSSALAGEFCCNNQIGMIRVQGTGEIINEPDVAFVNFGVETTHAELAAAQNENARITSSVRESLKLFDIGEDNIQTSNFSISPRYEYYGGISKKIGYQVNNMVRIKLKDLGIAGKLIDTVTAAGANIFCGIEFGLTEKSENYNGALRKALDSAHEKALLIADSQGVELGSLISVIEQGSNGIVYAREARAMAFSDGVSGSTVISAGKISITAVVEVAYSILY